MGRPLTAGWTCLVCGASVDIAQPLAWRCPNAVGDDRHHELELVQRVGELVPFADPNPFLAFRPYLAWDAYAAALGLTDAARAALVADLDARVAAVAGTGFVVTPFARADELSSALGFSDRGGVWIKDETHAVGGSHKARHLVTIMLHLLATEVAGRAPWTSPAGRPPLAIASCGNAAVAAATLAAAAVWPIRVFVPDAADPAVLALLESLGADVQHCPRLASDRPGDPCVHRFREAVAAGAVPFSVQGPENAWCLDGGRTIGWEVATQGAEVGLDRAFVQVGGGALAACLAAGMADVALPRVHAVQTASCAPLARAWHASERVDPAEVHLRWTDLMWPWEHVGTSAADGILDDETYDWLPVLQAMRTSNGSPLVVTEEHVRAANDLVVEHTDIDASFTGSAGLAGVLAFRHELNEDERIAVVLSGARR
ncbi:MAG: PLP-dependent lyase/thiolase [Actinobacteria bacterium]|nr:PLP-dependent lyase/thiolase [Actinomycetota bacterium]